MSEEKNIPPGKSKRDNSKPQKRRAGQSGNHTSVNNAEIVISGPNASVTLNKDSYRDFLAIYEHAFQQGRTGATGAIRDEFKAQADVSSKPERTSVFISYSRADKNYLEELHTHLAWYVRNEMISFWDDTMMKPGVLRYEKMRKELQSAKIAVLLVSPEFLASDFIATHVLPPLLTAAGEESVALWPVVLRPCAFKHCALAQFHAVNDPSRPLSKMTKVERDEIWASVAERLGVKP